MQAAWPCSWKWRSASALQKKKPRRTVMFVAFDQEETGLQGSTHFATHPPRQLRNLKACLTADMLGRSMADVMDEYVFVLGSETAHRLRMVVEEVKPGKGLKVGRLGADLVGTRSDYGPFRDQNVPFLFFSTGPHRDYHQPTDLPDRIDYVKLRRICLWTSELTRRLANDGDAPAWKEDPTPDLEEVRTVMELLLRVLKNPERHPLSQKQRPMIERVVQRLDAILNCTARLPPPSAPGWSGQPES